VTVRTSPPVTTPNDPVADPGAPERHRRRDPWPHALLGDGSLLVTLSRRAEVEQLSWPHVDGETHLGELRLVSVDDAGGQWLDAPDLDAVQHYDGDADVLVTRLTGERLGALEITDVVLPHDPVLMRRVCGVGRIGLFVRPELDGRARANGAYLDPRTGVLVLHRRDTVVAIGFDVPATGGVGNADGAIDDADALLGGRLTGGGITHGFVHGALLADRPADEVVIAIAMAETHDLAIERVVTCLAEGFASAATDRRASDRATLALGRPPLVDGAAAVLERRSQLVFSRVADRATGAVIAAPEADADFLRSGGYAFVWARDLAFIVLAHLASGRRDLAVPALRWLVRAQGSDGLWAQRNWTDATLAPSWGTQLDETAAALFVYGHAWSVLRDTDLDAHLWPSAAAAADALVATLDPATGLPAASMDLWETEVGIHTYTAATVVGGLRAAAAMAERHDPPRASGWLRAAERVRAGIDEHLWSEEHGRYLRSIAVARTDADGDPTPRAYGVDGHAARPVASVDPIDATVDVSLLGLVYPFAVMTPDEPRMAATIAAIEGELRTADGGILRYTGDRYLGGNPWVLATLWLGLARRAPGAVVPAEGVDYAVSARTSTDLLPEQVDEVTGEPVWIVPLTWSHAMYVLACHPPLAPVPVPLASE
jgi:glucoamylase